MAFNFNKLTVKSQEVVQTALEIAQNYNNQVIEPEHLLASLIQESGGLADTIMKKAGGNTNSIKMKANEMLEALPKVSGAGVGNQQLMVFGQVDEDAAVVGDECPGTSFHRCLRKLSLTTPLPVRYNTNIHSCIAVRTSHRIVPRVPRLYKLERSRCLWKSRRNLTGT